MHIQYVGKSGVLPEHRGLRFTARLPADTPLRPGARAELARVAIAQPPDADWEFRRAPAGAWVSVLTERGVGLRLADELPFEDEFEDTPGDAWLAATVAACPRCGAAIVWYEAGYAPGYRVCCGRARHHCRVCSDDESE